MESEDPVTEPSEATPVPPVSPVERVVTAVAWAVFVVVIAIVAFRLLAGCGFWAPAFLQPLSRCEAPEAAAPEADRLTEAESENRQLLDEYRDLRQSIAALPACPAEDCLLQSTDTPVDVLLLQDLSQSFVEELPVLRGMVESFIARREAGELSESVRLGLASFIDKPLEPYGGSDDYVLRLHAEIGSDLEELLAVTGGLATGWGGETGEEAQLEALQMVTEQPRSMGFRSEARRYVVLVTDAPPHVAGDWPDAPAANDGLPDRSDLDEDYPSVDQVADSLLEAGIVPVFLVTDMELAPFYQPIVDRVGDGAVIHYQRGTDVLLDTLLGGIQESCLDDAV